MLYERLMKPTLRDLVQKALQTAPQSPKPQPALVKPQVQLTPVPALVFTVTYSPTGEFVTVQREKVGAGTQKKPRKMHKSKLRAWYQSLECNGYDVRSMTANQVICRKGA